MSQQSPQQFSCPNCHAQATITTWPKINIDLNPELKPQLLNTNLWKWQCPHCHHETLIPWNTIYHDPTNHFIIFFNWDDKNIKPQQKYANFTPPMLPSASKNTTYRTVYGIYNLLERIKILENHLDDLAIEHLRYMLSHIVHPEIAQQGFQLYLEKFDTNKTSKFQYGEIDFSFYNENDKSANIITVPADTYYESKLAIQTDPRLKLNGNICIDQLWIHRQLKKRK